MGLIYGLEDCLVLSLIFELSELTIDVWLTELLFKIKNYYKELIYL